MSTTVKKPQKKERSNPLLMVLGESGEKIEDYLTKQPHQSRYVEDTGNYLKGASDYYDVLDKVDPVTESQLKSIFPRATATKMKDPLTTVDKTILHDNIRREGNTKRALLFLSHFLLGKETKIILDVNRRFANEKRRKEELDAINNQDPYLEILEDIMNRDEEVDIHSRLTELLFAGHGYGRSILVKQYNKKGYPCRLLPFSSPRLGRVWVDRKTHEFLGVEYLDYPSNSRILLAKDIIHYEVDDYLVSPNSRYYGMPTIEPSMYIAQSNRQANEIAKPEIMAREWAPMLLVKVFTKSEAKLREIETKWRAGKTMFYNSDIELKELTINHDLEKLTNTITENAKQIYRDTTVPLVVAFQDEQNRSTAESSMLQWYEGPLQFKRTHLNNIMWSQWYEPQLKQIFEEREIDRIAEAGQVMNYIMKKAQNTTTETMLPFKITMEFENIRTTGFLDTAAGNAQFFDRGLINDDIAREESGFGKYNNEMREYNQQKLLKSQTASNNMFSQEQDMQAQTETEQTPNSTFFGTPSLDSRGSSKFAGKGRGKGLPTHSSSDE